MDIELCVSNTRKYFETGATLDVSTRIEALKKLKAAIKSNENKIIESLKKDLNKADMEGYMTEIGMVYDEINDCLKNIRKWSRSKTVATPLAQFYSRSFVVQEPLGLVLVMAPWNYPFQLALCPVIGAIAAGNCVIIKPSAYAANVSNVIEEIISNTFDPKYISVIKGGRNETSALLDQKFDYIFFTGSLAVGKVVMTAAAKNVTPVTLELGGKSPVIIDSSANLKMAARRLAFGKVLNAGQTCVAPDHLFIEKSVKDEFLKLLVSEIKKMFPNGYKDMATIINDKHFTRITNLIKTEKIYFGGTSDPSRRFIEPTILTDVELTAPIMNEEIFGPVLPVIAFDSIEEVISTICSRPKPLALYLFTTNKDVEKKILSKCSFGGGCINDTIIHLATSNMGFGGVGSSGMGSYHGKKSFETFSHSKSIVKKANWIDLPFRYQPYSDSKFNIIKLFMK